MEIKFQIIETHPDQHSMVVRYWSDQFSQDDLATSVSYDQSGNKIIQRRDDGLPLRCQTDYNINIWQTPTPSSDAILKIANDSAPYDWFKLKHAVLDPTVDTSLGNVQILMGQAFVAVKTATPTEDIEALINNLLGNSSTGGNTVVV